MTYRLTFTVARPDGPRTLVTHIAGCTDATDAEQKLRSLYDGVLKVKSVTPAP